jgi:mycothiol system anti-sigma-R factor
MDCKTALTLLEAYLDNELDRADARELEAHVDTCAECRTELNRFDELRRALRDASLRHTAPQSLRERIRAAAHGADAGDGAVPAPPQSARYAMPAWPRLAAACVLAFAAGGVSVYMWNSAQSAGAQTQLARDLFASHWRALAAASPVDVVSADRHTVKPWFAGKIAEAPLVQDFAEQGFALAGGRIDYVGSERVAVLVYRHGQHLIDVFVLPQSDAAAVGKPMPSRGYTLDTIKLGDQPAAIVTDMDAAERSRFSGLLSSKQ